MFFSPLCLDLCVFFLHIELCLPFVVLHTIVLNSMKIGQELSEISWLQPDITIKNSLPHWLWSLTDFLCTWNSAFLFSFYTFVPNYIKTGRTFIEIQGNPWQATPWTTTPLLSDLIFSDRSLGFFWNDPSLPTPPLTQPPNSICYHFTTLWPEIKLQIMSKQHTLPRNIDATYEKCWRRTTWSC